MLPPVLAKTLLIFVSSAAIANGITCKASYGTNCTSATYCMASWQRVANSWTLQIQGCSQSTQQEDYVDRWVSSGPDFLIYKCSTDYCNSAVPPQRMKDEPVIKLPEKVTCAQRNSPREVTMACIALVCGITVTGTDLKQDCDNSIDLAVFVDRLPDKRYCTQTVVYSKGFIPKTTANKCVCRNTTCNQPEFLAWGEKKLGELPAVNCAISATNTARGNYCKWVKSVVNGRTVETYEAITSTLAKPKMGCTRVYGYAKETSLTTCYCNSDKCNVEANVPLKWPVFSANSGALTKPIINGELALSVCVVLFFLSAVY